MSKEIQCKCCKEYWWEMNIHSKSGLCPNCYDYVADIESKLAESEKALEAKESVNQMYKATLSLKDSDFSDLVRENAELKQQLTEAEKQLAISKLEMLHDMFCSTINNRMLQNYVCSIIRMEIEELKNDGKL